MVLMSSGRVFQTWGPATLLPTVKLHRSPIRVVEVSHVSQMVFWFTYRLALAKAVHGGCDFLYCVYKKRMNVTASENQWMVQFSSVSEPKQKPLSVSAHTNWIIN